MMHGALWSAYDIDGVLVSRVVRTITLSVVGNSRIKLDMMLLVLQYPHSQLHFLSQGINNLLSIYPIVYPSKHTHYPYTTLIALATQNRQMVMAAQCSANPINSFILTLNHLNIIPLI